MSTIEPVSKRPSRRSVVKGAAWAVPVVAVAAGAPAMAASQGLLSFTGLACKLPGNSGELLKGYVFELNANNALGRNPYDSVTVITSVAINGVPITVYQAVVRGVASPPSCSCSNCGPNPDSTKQFCTPDGTLNQQVLIYTGPEPTGNSQNAEMIITYQVYDCNITSTCTPLGPVQTLKSGSLGTPPRTGTVEPGGGSCKIKNVLPVPA